VNLAVAHPGELPGLALTLRGAVTLPLFGTVALPGADGVIHNAFAGIPDVPLARFELAFSGGANSPLNLTRDVCHGARQAVRAQFSGHNGVQATISAPLRVVGCAPVASLTRRGHKLTLRLTRGRDAAALKRATLKPPGLKSRRVKTRTTTFTLAKLPGRKRFRVTVKDASGQSWTLELRAKTPR
jgi:hypothetical protein